MVAKLVEARGLDLKVAWVSGDEVLPAVQRALDEGKSTFENVYTGEVLKEWKFKPLYAQAYLGGLGIATAFSKGAGLSSVACSPSLANDIRHCPMRKGI